MQTILTYFTESEKAQIDKKDQRRPTYFSDFHFIIHIRQ